LGRGQLADFLSGRRTQSLRIDLDLLVVTASPARTALKISQLICAVHFKTGIVFTLRFMKHNEYERGAWKNEL
jgi:hypothetical protein